MSELTRKRRLSLRANCNAVFVCGDSTGRGVVQNVSMSGLFIRSSLLPSQGTQIDAAIATPTGRQVAVHGIVRWNTAKVKPEQSPCGFGVMVTDPGREYLGFVDGALAVTGDL
jgi:hypothetical protein